MVVSEHEAIVREAIGVLKLSVAEQGPVHESHSAIVRRLRLTHGGLVVLKIPWDDAKLDRERAALQALSDLPLVPRLLDWFCDRKGSRAILMTHLRGEPLPSAGHCTMALAHQMGCALARVHERELSRGDGPLAQDSRAAMLHNLTSCVAVCRQYIPELDWSAVERGFALRLSSEKLPSSGRLVHFDFRLGNLLTDSGVLTGVVDYESSRNGIPNLDFSKISRELWLPHPELKDEMLAGYATVRRVPEALDSTLPLFHLHDAVACVSFCCKRGRMGSDAFFLENLGRVVGMLAEVQRVWPL